MSKKEDELLTLSDEQLFARYDNNSIESEKITAPRYSYWKSVFRVFFKKKINIVILAALGLVILLAYIYPMVIPYSTYQFKYQMNYDSFHLYPWKAIAWHKNNDGSDFHLIQWIFGSGSYGQPTFDEVWNGARISLSLAFVCAAINMTIGVVLGAIWGFSKKFDIIMNEVYNIIGNVPYVLIISVLILIFSPTFWAMVLALTITGWLGIAYFIRTQVIIIRDREYNLASRCLGTPILRLTMKNILPFMTSIIVTLLATEIPSYISYEVFLSYINIGMSDMTLGRLINVSKDAMITPGWEFEFWCPVAVSAVVTVVLYVVGQNLGDASDPRTHM